VHNAAHVKGVLRHGFGDWTAMFEVSVHGNGAQGRALVWVMVEWNG
jgi:hypothetical protein